MEIGVKFMPLKIVRSRLLLLPGFLALAVVSMFVQSQDTYASDEKRLSFYHTQTGEHQGIVYSRDGGQISRALDA